MTLIRVALTGGIATGKSYVLARFASKQIPTVDADTIAHDVVRAGRPASRDIRRRFGDDVFGANGEIDRPRLAHRVFSDPREREALEAIVHPLVRSAIGEWFQRIETEANATFAVADIPLLFETGRQRQFDRVVVTVCPESLQLERLMNRDGVTEAEARKRISAQLPTADKVAGADFTVHTDRTYAETDQQVDEIYDALCRGG